VKTRLFVLALLAASLPAVAAATPTVRLTAHLSGEKEVPPGPKAGEGTATLTIVGTRVCWWITIKGIGAPTGTAIHRGRHGKPGPVVMALGPAFDTRGCLRAPPARAIAKEPNAYYLNISTGKFPHGAIRGQLSKAR
jgi:hypothetical protein